MNQWLKSRLVVKLVSGNCSENLGRISSLKEGVLLIRLVCKSDGAHLAGNEVDERLCTTPVEPVHTHRLVVEICCRLCTTSCQCILSLVGSIMSDEGRTVLEPSNQGRKNTSCPLKWPWLKMPVLLLGGLGTSEPPAYARDTMLCMRSCWVVTLFAPYRFTA